MASAIHTDTVSCDALKLAGMKFPSSPIATQALNLGDLKVQRQGANTLFNFSGWKSTVALRKNDDGTISFITIDPTRSGFEFVRAERNGRRTLIIRDGQH